MSSYVSSLRPFGVRGYFSEDKNFHADKFGLIDPIICYAKGKRIGYVERDFITIHAEWINHWKVYTPRANNVGTELNDDNFNTFIGEPNTFCTESYLVIGGNQKLTESQCRNICKYFKTRFARFLHSMAKSSQDATSKTYVFIPVQNFTDNSDIDWNKTIPEIDCQLYVKYHLSDDEIAFIEKMIKPM